MIESVFVRKSYLGPGKGWKSVKAMTSAERAATRERLGEMKQYRRDGVTSSKYVEDPGLGVAWPRRFHKDDMRRVREEIGAKSTPVGPGKSVFDSDKVGTSSFAAKYGRNSVLGRSRKLETKQPNVLAHEIEHLRPNRSPFRLQELSSNPRKLGKEEARAEYMSNTGNYRKPVRDTDYYARTAAGDKSAATFLGAAMPNLRGKTDEFAEGYREVQDILHNKGIKPGARIKTNERYANKHYNARPGDFSNLTPPRSAAPPSPPVAPQPRKKSLFNRIKDRFS